MSMPSKPCHDFCKYHAHVLSYKKQRLSSALKDVLGITGLILTAVYSDRAQKCTHAENDARKNVLFLAAPASKRIKRSRAPKARTRKFTGFAL